MSEKSTSSVRLLSYEEDQPNDGQGMLIPQPSIGSRSSGFTPASVRGVGSRSRARFVVSIVGVLAMLILGATGYGVASYANLAAAPTLTIKDSTTQTSVSLGYGPQTVLSQRSIFTETRDAFIDEGLNFIEADLTNRTLRLFQKGVLLYSAEILGVGEHGSWWETPSGLFQVEKKDKEVFSNIGQAYFPWQITFQGNYVLHGWPKYPDQTAVMDEFTGGGIRLSDEDAEALYELVSPGMSVLVHSIPEKVEDNFVYVPSVPELNTPHYFVADIHNGTILASTDLNQPAPIASITKLMTALVAAEKIDLDGRIRVTSPTFVTSLVPRLAERSSVSMYSLLQLLLVESSNEAAETIAGEIGRKEFIEAMNAKARQLGMMNTQFADPSGLSADNISSVWDLYILSKYIYEQRSFIFDVTANQGLSTAYVGGEFGQLLNFNKLEGMDSFIGGKVGETLAAKQTSVSLHKLQIQGEERTVAIILLGSDDRVEDVEQLLTYVQSRFTH